MSVSPFFFYFFSRSSSARGNSRVRASDISTHPTLLNTQRLCRSVETQPKHTVTMEWIRSLRNTLRNHVAVRIFRDTNSRSPLTAYTHAGGSTCQTCVEARRRLLRKIISRFSLLVNKVVYCPVNIRKRHITAISRRRRTDSLSYRPEGSRTGFEVMRSRKKRPSGNPQRFYSHRLRDVTRNCRVAFAGFGTDYVEKDVCAGLIPLSVSTHQSQSPYSHNKVEDETSRKTGNSRIRSIDANIASPKLGHPHGDLPRSIP